MGGLSLPTFQSSTGRKVYSSKALSRRSVCSLCEMEYICFQDGNTFHKRTTSVAMPTTAHQKRSREPRSCSPPWASGIVLITLSLLFLQCLTDHVARVTKTGNCFRTQRKFTNCDEERNSSQPSRPQSEDQLAFYATGDAICPTFTTQAFLPACSKADRIQDPQREHCVDLPSALKAAHTGQHKQGSMSSASFLKN